MSIDFRIDSWDIDTAYNSNAQSLNALRSLLVEVRSNPNMSIDSLTVSGYASPDGSLTKNKELSLRRAVSLRNYLIYNCGVADSLMHFGENRVPWDLCREIIYSSGYPWAERALQIMDIGSDDDKVDNQRRINRLRPLAGGDAWRVLSRDVFPRLRSAFVITTLITEIHDNTDNTENTDNNDNTENNDNTDNTENNDNNDNNENTENTDNTENNDNTFYMALYTNMLFDAALVPNIGIEFHLGKHWSIAANYMHAWWSKDSSHRYWRIYGGDVNIRWWFGKKAHHKPLTGHHIGVYAQAITYDFEWGKKAYMAGKPGGTIFDRAHLGYGIEYGYSLPVARRLNIDFTLGVGYIGGKVYEFEPDGDRYVWTATKDRSWIGPTKLEVSLVWLLGRGNTNRSPHKEKGGGI